LSRDFGLNILALDHRIAAWLGVGLCVRRKRSCRGKAIDLVYAGALRQER
jgi:hypothetical protein